MTPGTLKEDIDACANGRFSASVQQGLAAASETYDLFLKSDTLRSNSIYGWNTYPGHLDKVRVDNLAENIGRFNKAFLDSHTFDYQDYYDTEQARHVLYAKLRQVAAGGTPLSGKTISALSDAVTGKNALKLPRRASYSSGDVLPGACLVRSIFSDAGELGPGELMSLINGSHVVVGLAFSMCGDLSARLEHTVANMCTFFRRSGVDAEYVEHMQGNLVGAAAGRVLVAMQDSSSGSASPQLPVSSRAGLDVLEQLERALNGFFSAVQETMHSPSGNPLVFRGDGASDFLVVRQASFLALPLVYALNDLKLAVLHSCHNTHRRLVKALDLLTDVDDPMFRLRFVQHPKYSLQLLQRIVDALNGAAFTYAGETSEGVEDFYTMSESTVDTMLDVLQLWGRMLDLESAVYRAAAEDST